MGLLKGQAGSNQLGTMEMYLQNINGTLIWVQYDPMEKKYIYSTYIILEFDSSKELILSSLINNRGFLRDQIHL